MAKFSIFDKRDLIKTGEYFQGNRRVTIYLQRLLKAGYSIA